MGKVHEIGKITMCCKHGRSATIVSVWMAFFAATLSPSLYAQNDTAARPIIGEAEINANDVYVRSGDSLNHYTIIKLKAGDRVTVVGERGEWYEILPPEGAFSLVSGDYIDTPDDKTGIVNGANVRVRAGSLLNENKYTVQALLNKGAEVTILGKNPDGFLRIKPPPGATLWINKSFAQLTSDTRPAGSANADTTVPSAEPVSPASDAADQQPATTIASAVPAKPSSKPAPPRAATATSEAQHRKLTELDTAVSKEYTKPVAQRNFESFMAQYRTIIAEAGDEFIQQYAQRRLEELQMALEATSSIDHWKKIEEIAAAKRREYRTARAAIPEAPPAGPSIEAQGELRISALFPPGGSPERYRLVDPSTAGERTIAYVEIPSGSNIRVNDFLNKFVGVRALERRVQSGGVNPIPIYIADDLVLLEPPDVQSNARPSP